MENEIYHHGILGQKWGVRNGPPYPLGSKNRENTRIDKSKLRVYRQNIIDSQVITY